MTASFLASATRALPMPDRLAIASARSFNSETFLTRHGHEGSLIHQSARKRVIAPRYVSATIDLPGMISSGREPAMDAYRA
jgi:hypothetical protein